VTTAEAVTALAPAKINLTLHVTGRRPDGYHLLDSLVVFAGREAADRVEVRHADDLSLTITGPRATGVPDGPDNLVLKAAAVLARDRGAAITLDKHLPAAGGIGGGTSDGAATLRALSKLWGEPLPDTETALGIGADMPVCLTATPSRMAGIGDLVSPVHDLPDLWAVLVNPGVEVATPDVFRALSKRDNAPMPTTLPQWATTQDLITWLATQRNDLEPPARALAPAIDEVLRALAAQPGCGLARMSGSGATCFGLFTSAASAHSAADALDRGTWWVRATQIGSLSAT